MGKYQHLAQGHEALKVTCDETFRKYDLRRDCSLEHSDLKYAIKDLLRSFSICDFIDEEIEESIQEALKKIKLRNKHKMDPEEFYEFTKAFIVSHP